MKARRRKFPKHATTTTSSEVVSSPPKSPLFAMIAAALFGIILIGCIVVSANSMRNRPIVVRKPAFEPVKFPSFGELTMMTKEELGKQDLALLNLRAAEGLPGSEGLDVPEKLSTLDLWASRVRAETDRNFHQFHGTPKEFNDSEAYFRMLLLVTVLQQDFGVHYNLERIKDVDFTRSQDLFIHGLIGESNGGTCVSMPVLYTAIARRLGYPVYLVHAKEHLFCRWDGDRERFNIEGTNRGMNTFDDEHYMTWPHPIDKSEVDRGHYLKSLTAAESFSAFLAARGHCLEDTGERAEAGVSYSLAVKHHPSQPMYRSFLSRLVRPKRMEDFPELMAQQGRLRQHGEMQRNLNQGPMIKTPDIPSGFEVFATNPSNGLGPNQSVNPLGTVDSFSYPPSPYGVPSR